MLKTLRFLAALPLILWLGCVVTLTFYVAPSLFGNQSGVVADTSMAGEIMGPLLRKMYVTAWLALPTSCALLGVLWAMSRRGGRAVAVACLMMAAAWGVDVFSGVVLQGRMHRIRVELKQEFGGYHRAPDDNPQRARFRRLHGASMVLVLFNLILGTGALFCVTQLAPGASEDR